MTDYIIEALIRTSIIITILSIVILIISKFVTKYIGYRWRKIAWLIMLVCAIIPWGINPISLSEKTTQLYSQEERKINDVENYSQSKKNIEDNKQKEHNQVVFETKAIKEKSDAIFLKMPVMDGFEATRRIRTLSKTIPIIARTAFAFEREKEIAKQCEFTDYVVKPIDIKELKKLIVKVLA